jgi:hypothetical protein
MVIYSRKLMVVHYYLGTITLAVMALCWIGIQLTPWTGPLRAGLVLSSVGQLASIGLFVYNIFRSVKSAPQPQEG